MSDAKHGATATNGMPRMLRRGAPDLEREAHRTNRSDDVRTIGDRIGQVGGSRLGGIPGGILSSIQLSGSGALSNLYFPFGLTAIERQISFLFLRWAGGLIQPSWTLTA